MKKSSVLKIISLAAFAMAGGLAVANHKSAKKAESASAATTSVTLAGSFNGWSTTAHPLTLDGDYWTIEKTLDADATFKIVVNGSDWVGDGDGVTWCNGLGSEGKGQNFKVLTAGTYIIKAAKTIGDYGDKSYGIVFENSVKYTVNFYSESSDLLDSQTVSKGNSASYTAPEKADEGEKHYSFDAWRDNLGNDKTAALASVQSDLDVYASYTWNYKEGRYIVTGTFDIADGYLMDYVDGQLEKTVTLAYGQAFKIVYWNGSSIEWTNDGYSSFTMAAEAYHYFGPDGDNNLVCVAAGTYTFYYSVTDPYTTDYGVEKWISAAHVGSMTAQHLAAQLKGFGDNPSEDSCGEEDKFPAMKAIFLGLSATEKSLFQGYVGSDDPQFSEAYARYVAWALALGEKPWEEGKTSGAPYIANGSDSNNLIVIVSIVSLVSVSTLVGLIVIKRRRGIAK